MKQQWRGWTVTLGVVGQQRRFIAYGSKPWADDEIRNDWRRWGVQFFPTRRQARAYLTEHGHHFSTQARIQRGTCTITVKR